MKEKILAALKTKYAKFGFSESILDTTADMLGSKVTEEDQIQAEVDGVEVLLKSFQSEADRRVSEALKKGGGKANNEDGKSEGKKGNDDETGKQSNPDVKELLEAVKGLKEELNTFKQSKDTDLRTAAFKEIIKEVPEKQRNILEKQFSKMQFQDQTEFDSFIEETKTDVEVIVSETKAKGLAQFGTPFNGSTDSKSVENAIENWAKQ